MRRLGDSRLSRVLIVVGSLTACDDSMMTGTATCLGSLSARTLADC